MYLLLEKSTNIVRDIQVETFGVTEDFEWVENKDIETRAQVGWIYDKQTKEFTAPELTTQRPSEISNSEIAQKLVELDAKIENTKGGREPILGAAQPQPTFNWLYLLVIPVVIGAYFLGKKLKS